MSRAVTIRDVSNAHRKCEAMVSQKIDHGARLRFARREDASVEYFGAIRERYVVKLERNP